MPPNKDRKPGDVEPNHARWRAFTSEGKTFRLLNDEQIRSSDLVNGIVTLLGEDGTVVTVAPEHLLNLAGPPSSSSHSRYPLRLLLEEVLDCGFDDRWIYEILGFAARHHLISPRKGTP